MDSHMFDGLVTGLLVIGAIGGAVSFGAIYFLVNHLTIGWVW